MKYRKKRKYFSKSITDFEMHYVRKSGFSKGLTVQLPLKVKNFWKYVLSIDTV